MKNTKKPQTSTTKKQPTIRLRKLSDVDLKCVDGGNKPSCHAALN